MVDSTLSISSRSSSDNPEYLSAGSSSPRSSLRDCGCSVGDGGETIAAVERGSSSTTADSSSDVSWTTGDADGGFEVGRGGGASSSGTSLVAVDVVEAKSLTAISDDLLAFQSRDSFSWSLRDSSTAGWPRSQTAAFSSLLSLVISPGLVSVSFSAAVSACCVTASSVCKRLASGDGHCSGTFSRLSLYPSCLSDSREFSALHSA